LVLWGAVASLPTMLIDANIERKGCGLCVSEGTLDHLRGGFSFCLVQIHSVVLSRLAA